MVGRRLHPIDFRVGSISCPNAGVQDKKINKINAIIIPTPTRHAGSRGDNFHSSFNDKPRLEQPNGFIKNFISDLSLPFFYFA
jgi:hypothetical protein